MQSGAVCELEVPPYGIYLPYQAGVYRRLAVRRSLASCWLSGGHGGRTM